MQGPISCEANLTTPEVSYNLAGCIRNMSLPVAGTTILLYDYWSTGTGLIRHFIAEQTTNSKGEFSFDVRKGLYSLEVVPNRDTRFARQSVDTIKVTTNTTLNLSLKNGAVYSGRVRTISGETIPSCELLFFGIEPEPVRAAEPVGWDGAFSITLPKGKYYVACRRQDESDESEEHSNNSFLCPTLQVLELDRDVRANYVLPDVVTFKGVVTNADGHPVPDVKVTIVPSNPSDNLHAEEALLKGICYTNKLGQFECDVEPGTYDVKLEPGPSSHLSERTVSSILVDRARTRNYSLGPGYRLNGVVAFDGQPVENALVTVFGGKIDSAVLTDKRGRYSFSLSGGSYALSVAPQPDSLARTPFRLLSPFNCVVSLTEDTQQNIALEKGVAISGKVTDQAGAPRPAVQLALYANTKKAPPDTINGADRAISYGITGDDGSYEFRVKQGEYWLVMNNQISTAQLLTAQEDDIESDLTWQSGCLITFQVVSEVDEPVPHCRVFYELYNADNDSSHEPEHVSAGEDGVCQLIVSAGIYSFRFQPPEHGSFQAKSIRQLSVNSDTHRKVKLGLKPVSAQPSS